MDNLSSCLYVLEPLEDGLGYSIYLRTAGLWALFNRSFRTAEGADIVARRIAANLGISVKSQRVGASAGDVFPTSRAGARPVASVPTQEDA